MSITRNLTTEDLITKLKSKKIDKYIIKHIFMKKD